MPDAHESWETFADEHAVLQAPQLAGSVCVSVHPLGHIVSGAPHAGGEHTPPWHVDPAPLSATQLFPHPPQLFPSVLVSVSHPSARMLSSQSA